MDHRDTTPLLSPSAKQQGSAAAPTLIPPKLRVFLYVVAVVHCMGALGFGYNSSIVSPALAPVSDEWDLNTFQQECVVSIILIACLIGALVAGILADMFGRNKVLIANDFVFLIGIGICSGSVEYYMLLVGRFITGLGIGVASVVVPLMVTEIAPKSIRGEIGTTNQLCITIGIELSYIVGTAFTGVKYDWRWMFAFAALFPIIHVVGAFVIRVETPRWLIIKGKATEAQSMLSYLRLNGDITAEFEELEQSSKQPAGKKVSGLAVFSLMKWRPVVISLGLSFFQQITGINAIMYYMSTFFQKAGMSADSSNLVSILVGAINIFMTVVSVFILDRAGRKPLLLIGLSSMILSLFGIAAAFFFDSELSDSAMGAITIVCTITFVMGFAVSLGCVPWIVISEVCTNEIRAVVMSLALGVSWITNFAVSASFLSLIDLTNEQTVFFGFMAFAVIALIFSFILIPETKGKSPDQIAFLMAGGKVKHKHHHHHHHHHRDDDEDSVN